jgi:hypothetical protein
MYLEIDEGFDSHPKTVRMCRVMKDVNAGQYMIRIWAWAVRSAPDGDLSGMQAADIEAIAKYAKADGKLFEALTAKWSPKFGPWIDVDGETVHLHGWGERQGAAIKRLEKNAACMRVIRERAKSQREQNVSTTCAPRVAHVTTSPDQTSPDKTRPEREFSRDPGSTENQAPPASEPGKPAAFNVVSQYLAIRAETIGGAKNLFAQPPTSDVTKAAEWIAAMTPEECSDIEPAIRLACKHVKDGAQGWTNPDMTKVGFMFGCIVRAWPDLREELHNCAPKPKTVDRNGKQEPPRRSTPVRYA